MTLNRSENLKFKSVLLARAGLKRDLLETHVFKMLRYDCNSTVPCCGFRFAWKVHRFV